MNSGLAPRSNGTIEIRVSVAPRFVTSASIDRPQGGIAIASLAPGLRYHVVAKDLQSTKPGQRNPLYLIVPD